MPGFEALYLARHMRGPKEERITSETWFSTGFRKPCVCPQPKNQFYRLIVIQPPARSSPPPDRPILMLSSRVCIRIYIGIVCFWRDGLFLSLRRPNANARDYELPHSLEGSSHLLNKSALRAHQHPPVRYKFTFFSTLSVARYRLVFFFLFLETLRSVEGLWGCR